MDNLSAIRLIKNPEFHKRSKHIDIRYHFVKEKYEAGDFELEHVSTNEMNKLKMRKKVKSPILCRYEIVAAKTDYKNHKDAVEMCAIVIAEKTTKSRIYAN